MIHAIACDKMGIYFWFYNDAAVRVDAVWRNTMAAIRLIHSCSRITICFTCGNLLSLCLQCLWPPVYWGLVSPVLIFIYNRYLPW